MATPVVELRGHCAIEMAMKRKWCAPRDNKLNKQDQDYMYLHSRSDVIYIYIYGINQDAFIQSKLP